MDIRENDGDTMEAGQQNMILIELLQECIEDKRPGWSWYLLYESQKTRYPFSNQLSIQGWSATDESGIHITGCNQPPLGQPAHYCPSKFYVSLFIDFFIILIIVLFFMYLRVCLRLKAGDKLILNYSGHSARALHFCALFPQVADQNMVR